MQAMATRTPSARRLPALKLNTSFLTHEAGRRPATTQEGQRRSFCSLLPTSLVVDSDEVLVSADGRDRVECRSTAGRRRRH